MSHRHPQRARSAPATQRAGTRAHTQAPTARRRENDGSQLIILGACLLGVGLVAAIGVAFAASNDTHPVVKILPWLPVAVGFFLLVYALSRVTVSRRSRAARSEPSDALEPNDGLPGGAG